MLGAVGAIVSFLSATSAIPFMPEGWAASAGGFPAMTETVAFLMKDVVLLAVSIYLLKQDATRVAQSAPEPRERREWRRSAHPAGGLHDGKRATS